MPAAARVRAASSITVNCFADSPDFNVSGVTLIFARFSAAAIVAPIARSAFGSLTKTTRRAFRALKTRSSDSVAMPTPRSHCPDGRAAERR